MNKANPEITIHGSPIGFVYLLSVNSHYKIGHSNNVDGVLASARRFDSSARLITCWVGNDVQSTEREIHAALKQYRIEGEQFRFPPETVQWIASLDDREFGAWMTEAGFDVRTVGWEFPRVHMIGSGHRMWASVYFPKTDTVSWAMVGMDAKPDYSDLERMWLMNHRGFNSAWLGRPKKFGGAKPTDADMSNRLLDKSHEIS